MDIWLVINAFGFFLLISSYVEKDFLFCKLYSIVFTSIPQNRNLSYKWYSYYSSFFLISVTVWLAYFCFKDLDLLMWLEEGIKCYMIHFESDLKPWFKLIFKTGVCD